MHKIRTCWRQRHEERRRSQLLLHCVQIAAELPPIFFRTDDLAHHRIQMHAQVRIIVGHLRAEVLLSQAQSDTADVQRGIDA